MVRNMNRIHTSVAELENILLVLEQIQVSDFTIEEFGGTKSISIVDDPELTESSVTLLEAEGWDYHDPWEFGPGYWDYKLS